MKKIKKPPKWTTCPECRGVMDALVKSGNVPMLPWVGMKLGPAKLVDIVLRTKLRDS